MDIWTLLAAIVVISVAVYFLVRPLQVFSSKQWLISHGFIVVGLGFITGWFWLNRDQFLDFDGITMLVGGIWTVAGGLCFMMAYLQRRKATT